MLEFKPIGKEQAGYAAFYNGEMLPLQTGIKIESLPGDFTFVTVSFLVPENNKDIIIRDSHYGA